MCTQVRGANLVTVNQVANRENEMRYQEFKRNEHACQPLSKLNELKLDPDVEDRLAFLLSLLFSDPSYKHSGIRVVKQTSDPHEFMKWVRDIKAYNWKLLDDTRCVGDILDPVADDGYGLINTDWDCDQQQVLFHRQTLYVYNPPC